MRWLVLVLGSYLDRHTGKWSKGCQQCWDEGKPIWEPYVSRIRSRGQKEKNNNLASCNKSAQSGGLKLEDIHTFAPESWVGLDGVLAWFCVPEVFDEGSRPEPQNRSSHPPGRPDSKRTGVSMHALEGGTLPISWGR